MMKLYINKQWPNAVVYEVGSLHETIDAVFDVDYDLLILDIEMPGSELLEHFVAQATKHTRVVIFSSYDNNDSRVVNLLKIGANGFISKTASQEQVISTLLFVFGEF